MLYTGCRTNEAAGLQVRDFRLEANMPHVVFRTNELRRMDKNGLERAVPLMTPVVDAYRLYEHEKRPDKPLSRNMATQEALKTYQQNSGMLLMN